MEFGPILRSMSRSKVRYGLIVLEIALTLAIVTNCVSLIRDAKAELGKDSGFDDEHILSVRSQPFAPEFKEADLRELAATGPRRSAAAARRQGRLEHPLFALAGGRELNGAQARRREGALAEDANLQRGRRHVRDARRIGSRRSRVPAGRSASGVAADHGSPREGASARRGRNSEGEDLAGRRDQPGIRAARVRSRLRARQTAGRPTATSTRSSASSTGFTTRTAGRSTSTPPSSRATRRTTWRGRPIWCGRSREPSPPSRPRSKRPSSPRTAVAT